MEIHIILDEKMNPEISKEVFLESKVFMEPVSVMDFSTHECIYEYEDKVNDEYNIDLFGRVNQRGRL